MPKTYAIGDIHVGNQQFIVLLPALNIQSDDTLIFLGDVIDRGADSKACLMLSCTVRLFLMLFW